MPSIITIPDSMPFDESYFSSHTYQNVSFHRFSQYWWSNHFYARLARRHGRHAQHLLEIGSGLGHLVGLLDRRFDAFAVDVNFWALCQSRTNAPRTKISQASAEELPYPDGTFDVVVCKHVVEHLEHPEKAVSELGRVSMPGCVLIFSTPNLESLFRSRKGGRWVGYRDPTHISLRPPSEWLALLKGAGFQITRLFTDGFWDVPYIPFVPELLQKIIFGAPGGVQVLAGLTFLPLRWGESMMVIARKMTPDE